MITPTVGRIVWFYPGNGARSRMNAIGDQPFRADIVYVSDTRRVSLNVDDHLGMRHFVAGAMLLQDDDRAPEGVSYAMWMPYQKAVAKGEIPPTVHATGSPTIATSGTELDSH